MPTYSEPAFLLDRLVGLCIDDRHRAVGQTRQEDGLPLQALGRVQRGKCDASHRWHVPDRAPNRELGGKAIQVRLRIGGEEVSSKLRKCFE